MKYPLHAYVYWAIGAVMVAILFVIGGWVVWAWFH